ncbi:MAG: DUF58 domain-containing protein [Chloroflexi bacterium]|jgi:uncharacterized protein (DUF58 family)|nr:DUF58 domain-containing protein [Chloroflexota bacterium]
MNRPPWWSVLVILLILALIFRRGALAVFSFILLLATLASELWARYSLSNVTYRRVLGDAQISFGEETTLTLEFTNAKPLPLAWLLVRDRYPRGVNLLTEAIQAGATGQQEFLLTMVALRWYERLRRIHRVQGPRRGVFQFGPAQLSSGDVFGFRRQFRDDVGVERLTVYPKVVPVHELGLPAGRPMGEWGARRKVVEDPLRFSTVREYTPGDNPRFIHWKATARTGSLQSKVFDPSDTLSVTLAVDVRTRARAYEYVPEYLEYVISTAASVAVHALGERYMVGLAANGLGEGGETWVHIRPGRHPQQATQLLTMLASLEPFRGLPFEEMLYSIQASLPFGSTVVAVTAVPTPGLYEALLSLEQTGHRVLLLTVGDEEPAVPELLNSYYLGGTDAWHRLEALAVA